LIISRMALATVHPKLQRTIGNKKHDLAIPLNSYSRTHQDNVTGDLISYFNPSRTSITWNSPVIPSRMKNRDRNLKTQIEI
ncbi:hypothetical protein, partial [uncultured Gimesia sp.]|uniref:hypothetical protein n=1 Tax=uncultured Gimesia sp. TaxID=1678688 RepID=UPI00261E14DB